MTVLENPQQWWFTWVVVYGGDWELLHGCEPEREERLQTLVPEGGYDLALPHQRPHRRRLVDLVYQTAEDVDTDRAAGHVSLQEDLHVVYCLPEDELLAYRLEPAQLYHLDQQPGQVLRYVELVGLISEVVQAQVPWGGRS